MQEKCGSVACSQAIIAVGRPDAWPDAFTLDRLTALFKRTDFVCYHGVGATLGTDAKVAAVVWSAAQAAAAPL
jgi:hypothetical protein